MKRLIQVRLLEDLKAKVSGLNKLAVKCGTNPVVMTLTGEIAMKEVRVGKEFVSRPFVEVELRGETPRIPGFEILATVEHSAEGNIVRRPQRFDVAVDGENNMIDLSAYYRGSKCEHCGIRRGRNKTFIVKTDAGELKQVGSSCLKDFTGHDAPEDVAAWFETVSEIGEEYFRTASAEDLGFWETNTFDSERDGFALRSVLATAIARINTRGFVSSKEASETGKSSTGQWVWAYIIEFISGDVKLGERLEITDAIRAEASKVIEWARQLNVKNDYLNNLKVLLTREYCLRRDVNTVVSAIVAFRKATSQVETGNNVYVGKVGEKVSMNVRCDFVKDLSGEFTRILCKFTDDKGRKLCWFSSKVHEFGQGDTLFLEGTVKGHSEFNGIKETQLTRCKVRIPQTLAA